MFTKNRGNIFFPVKKKSGGGGEGGGPGEPEGEEKREREKREIISSHLFQKPKLIYILCIRNSFMA